ncbi:SDR family oxidoreductase [Veronia pacifica]|uniref:Short-chain dehydrogenase n=1 Tax=Veronia pacifica TaxID=1080227 RepID=A0A1C3ER40_9GAMM|nr:SDR family oxidoreductase [Veronia pacifica]ODA35702.1 short-chain dehydrogenase [Veronia pacifica]
MPNTLITCATSHIGLSVAENIVVDGKLVLTGRDQDKLNKLCKSLSSKATSVHLDFFDSQSIQQASETIASEGQIDKVVFIIPRIPPKSEVFSTEEELISDHLNFFIKPLQLFRLLFEADAISDSAKIVIVSGLSTKSALSHYATNNTIRSAWLGQAKTMSLALGERRIAVNTLSLGAVMTDSYRARLKQRAVLNGVTPDEQLATEVDNIAMKKYAEVGDVVDAILSLTGPMAKHITGQNILMDGGFFRGY